MVDLTEAAEQMRVEEELDEVNIHNSRDQLKHTGKQLTYSLKWSQEGDNSRQAAHACEAVFNQCIGLGLRRK